MAKREGAPIPDKWYTLTLGSSFNDLHPPQPSPKVCTLRYDFIPASIDKSQPGTLHRKKDKINVEFNHNQPNKPKLIFEGTGEDLKENDAVMYFDGSSFRLERVHRAVKRLKYSRSREHASSAAVDPSSPPVGRGSGKSQPQAGNNRMPSLTPPRSNQALPPPPPPPQQPVSVEVEQIDIGEVERIDTGEVERIDAGEDEQIDIDDEEQIDIGEVERIDIGEVERIDVGEVERIDIGDAVMSEGKSRNNNPTMTPASEHNGTPDSRDFDLEAHLDIMNDDDDDDAFGSDKNAAEGNQFTGIDINIPHQNDTDDEIADVDVNDDNGVMGGNAAAALRAQVHRQENDDQTSSSSATSGSDSSGSSRSSSSARSSSDSDSSDSVNSI